MDLQTSRSDKRPQSRHVEYNELVYPTPFPFDSIQEGVQLSVLEYAPEIHILSILPCSRERETLGNVNCIEDGAQIQTRVGRWAEARCLVGLECIHTTSLDC